MLSPLIKKSLDWCFDNNMQKSIAWGILCGIDNQTKNLKSLEILALKAFLDSKMRNYIEGNVLVSLIFREPLHLGDFMDRWRYRNVFRILKRKIVDRFNGYSKRHKIFLELRKDPHIMYAAFEQNFRKYNCNVYIELMRTQLVITYRRSIIATIPHRQNHEFDTYWATRFFHLCVNKCCCSTVSLQMEGEGKYDWAYMRDYVNEMINSVDSVVPAEGWEAAIEREERPVYRRYSDALLDNTKFSTQFVLAPYYPPYDRYVCFG